MIYKHTYIYIDEKRKEKMAKEGYIRLSLGKKSKKTWNIYMCDITVDREI